VRLEPADALPRLTDGATELFESAGHEQGTEGWRQLVRAQFTMVTSPAFIWSNWSSNGSGSATSFIGPMI